MRPSLRIVKILGILALALSSVACGGGSSSSGSSSSGTGTSTGSGGTNNPPPLTNQERTQAADTTVSGDQACTSLTPFYWEIGDKGGTLASGTGGDKSGAPPSSTSLMAIASASKWVFSSYALEKLDVSASNPLTTTEVQYLNFKLAAAQRSGRDGQRQ